MSTQELDFVAIGDITTDTFLELKNANVWNDGGIEKLCMRFGAKIEYDDATVVPAVGNSPNAAVSAHRLGLNTALVTNLGDDLNGDTCMEALQDEGVSTKYITIQNGQKTNHNYILRHGAERTILLKHHEYTYTIPDFATPPKWIYFSSVGEHALPFHHKIAQFLEQNPYTKLAFQPGTHQIKLGIEPIKDLYKNTEIFFCNKEEAQNILITTEEDIPTLVREVQKHGPRFVVITDGPRGAFAGDEYHVYHLPMYPDPAPPVDRTGAGDSFSSTTVAMLALGLTLPDALLRGPINSMSVVQHIGAQKGLLTREQIEEYLSKAPTDYRLHTVL